MSKSGNPCLAAHSTLKKINMLRVLIFTAERIHLQALDEQDQDSHAVDAAWSGSLTSFLSLPFLCPCHTAHRSSLSFSVDLEKHYCMMSSLQKCQRNKRNKILHRFYEPLVLLHVLDKIQGDHVPRQRDESSPPDHASRTELRRRFLESLAYVCDHEKGGDTMTAIFVSSAPLTYHVATNKPLPETNKVVPFLDSLLTQLRTVAASTTEQERCVLERCVAFSEKRITTYWQSLRNSLIKCRESTLDTEVLQRKWKVQ